MLATNTFKELGQVLELFTLTERHLHRLRCVTVLDAAAHVTTLQRLHFLREFANSLAVGGGQRPRYAVEHFKAIAAEILGPLQQAEARLPHELRFEALYRWAESRVTAPQGQPERELQLRLSLSRLTVQFRRTFEFATMSPHFDAPERDRIANGLLEAYHEALYNMLGDADDPGVLPPT
ncbi:MAG: hypothetical protein HGA45_10715 [Chloroflexales bacterium]|nr:hypothetical protein [Chloroflexales bacterium]